MKKSIISALESLQLPQDQSFLVQFWAAIEIGNTYVLTTTCQPFGVCGINRELESYRIACLDHKLYVHREKRIAFGLPGRVFLNRFPQQTQNVHDYPKDQRPPCQDDDDIFSKIWGSFAVPVIEANKCVGVLEFMTDPPQDSYDNDIRVVYDALQSAGLRSSIQIHCPREVIASPTPWRSIRRSSSLTKTKYCCLVPYFGLSSAEAAKRLEISQGTFRNVRSRVGIPEWPWIPSYKTTCRAFSALETETNLTDAGTISELTTAIDDMHYSWDLGTPDLSYTENGTSLSEGQFSLFEPLIDQSEDQDQDMMNISSLFDFESWNMHDAVLQLA